MNVTKKSLERGQIELTIELTPEEYQPFLERAAQLISQDTKIPGIRPGKASLASVKQRVGEGELWQQAFEPAVRKTLLQALEKEQLKTVGSPHVDAEKLAPGNAVVFKAIVSLLPAVTLPDLTTIKLSPKKVSVSDQQVQDALTDLQKMRASSASVNRAAQNGDKVEVNYEMFLDKVPVEGGQHEKVTIVLGENKFLPDFEKAVVGVQAGQTKEFDVAMPKEHHQKMIAGKTVTFKIRLENVFEQKLPEINDEFAKNVGAFENASQLKEAIKKNLGYEAEQAERSRIEEEMLDALINKARFGDLPDVLIDSETKKMLQEMEHRITQQGMSFEDYLQHLKKTRDQLLLDFSPQAVKRVKSALILRQVAEQEKISATETEVNAELEQSKRMYSQSPEALKQLEQPEYKQYLFNVITSRKVIEFLKSKVVE